MPESIITREFGTEAGMPKDNGVIFVPTIFEGITIWAELTPSGKQHLVSEDIKEELQHRMPASVKKYISAIILSPFYHPMDDEFHQFFASLCDLPGFILISSRPESSRRELVEYIRMRGALRHEAGHIIDRMISKDGTKFSYGPEWADAKRLDHQVRKSSSKYSGDWIFGSAQTYFQRDYEEWKVNEDFGEKWGLEEDFADSIRYFTGSTYWRRCFKRNYPNRYNIIRSLLK